MKLKLTPIVLVAVLLVILSSCSNKADVPVPADAAFVLHIDGKSLNEKLSWDEIKQNAAFKKAYEEAANEDELVRKIMDNPENSGVDTKSDVYFFMRMRSRGAYVSFVCNIKDEKAFNDLVTKATKGATVKKEGGLSMIVTDNAVLSWNSSRLAAIIDAPDAYQGGGGFDMSNGGGKSFGTDSLVFFAKEVHTLKSKQSLGSNSKFSSLLKEKGDAHIWVNGGTMYGGSLPAMLALTKVALLFEGNISAATVNFENGKITFNGKSYFNKEMEALYKKYSVKNVDPAIYKNIPGDVAAVMAMNYSPEAIKEFISMLGVDGLVNMFLGKENFSIDDFIKANKGEAFFAVSDFKVVTKENTVEGTNYNHNYPSEYPEAKILFGAAIGDRASFDKTVNLITSKIKEESGENVSELAKKVPFTIKNNWFLAGNDSVFLNSYGAGSTDHAFISKISGHPFGGYLDIQKFINGARPAMKDSVATMIADQSLKLWQDIVFYGGEFKDGALTTYGEINMVDKSTNSLKQLNSYFDFIAQQLMFKQAEIMRDGLDILPPPPPVEVQPTPKKK